MGVDTEEQDILGKKIKSLINDLNEEIKIANNEDYILWVEEYIKANEKIISPQMKKNLPEEIKSKINKLGILYDVIKKYANDNFLYPTKDKYMEYFYIEYHDTKYRIGSIKAPKIKTTMYFIEIDEDNTKNKTYIDYKDIINKKGTKKQESVQERLAIISDIITKLHEEEGIPFNELEGIINIRIEVLKSKEREENKRVKNIK